ncbi:MAG: hypothetical protein WA110_08350 [Anaerolineaceae bacterium]
MKPKLNLILLVLPAVILTCACSGGKVLYEDDFSDPSSGWDQYSGSNATNDYHEGSYQIKVQETYFDQWALAHRDFENIVITVDATKISGSDDNNFGLLCNYQDMQHFYMLLISSDGNYIIQKMSPDGLIRLSSDWFEPSEAINKGVSTNHLKAECGGGSLALYANDDLVGQVDDADYTSGDIGFLVGTYGEGDVQVSFDDLVVTELD